METRLALAAIVVALATAACATTTETSTIPTYPVSGIAMAGPTCPVVQDPPAPGCDDRPVRGATLHVLDGDGQVRAQAVTDGNGRFEILVPAGAYVLEPQPVEGLLGTASPQPFDAGPGLDPDLLVQYDTGIR